MVNRKTTEKIIEVRKKLTQFVSDLYGRSTTPEKIAELMALRGYHTMDMYEQIDELEMTKVSTIADLKIYMPEYTDSDFRDFGILTAKGEYLLADRFVFPIRDIKGQVTALVGWKYMGGAKKYITTPTYGFSRDTTFFMFDKAVDSLKSNGIIYVVEGIFGAISMNSIGLPTIAVQGIEISKIKSIMLTRFKKVIFIPDNDSSGLATNKYLNEMSGKSIKFIWKTDAPTLYTRLQGVYGIDIDEYIRDYDCYETLKSLENVKYMKAIDVTKDKRHDKEIIN